MALTLHFEPGVAIPTLQEIQAELSTRLPEAKVKFPWLNKKVLMVQNGPVLATIRIKRGTHARVSGSINTQYPGIMIPMILGILFGMIGMVIVLGIAYVVNRTKTQEHEQLVFDVLNDSYNLSHKIESEFGDGT